ncbi:MAG TPA: nuclear transport factor 2 family protein [bacterium]|nr:nuclear transport factor 2 family protein [bacterium]
MKRLFEAVRRRDQAALLDAYHPQVSIHEAPSLPYGGTFHGHSGAIEHVQRFYRTWEGLKPPELFKDVGITRPRLFAFLEAAQDHVVVIGRQLAVAPNGSSLDVPETFVFKMQDNRVIESWMFNQDTVAILEFLRNAGR